MTIVNGRRRRALFGTILLTMIACLSASAGTTAEHQGRATGDAEAGPEPSSPTARAAIHSYQWALRNARMRYLRQLEMAMNAAGRIDDLEEADRIATLRNRALMERARFGDDDIIVFRMHGTKSWEDSGVRVQRGQTIDVSAPGAAINPRKVRTVHGIRAAVGSLLMKIDGKIHNLGKGTEVVAERDGLLQFRSNLSVSPNHKIDVAILVK